MLLAETKKSGFFRPIFSGFGRFILLLALAAGCASVGIMIQRAVGFSYWWYYPIVGGIGVALYASNALFIGLYIRRRASEFASNEEVVPGVQMWELTAGLGVVPKWVSWIGILAMGFFLAAPFELIALTVRTFG